jgi:hypothetical protein
VPRKYPGTCIRVSGRFQSIRANADLHVSGYPGKRLKELPRCVSGQNKPIREDQSGQNKPSGYPGETLASPWEPAGTRWDQLGPAGTSRERAGTNRDEQGRSGNQRAAGGDQRGPAKGRKGPARARRVRAGMRGPPGVRRAPLGAKYLYSPLGAFQAGLRETLNHTPASPPPAALATRAHAQPPCPTTAPHTPLFE